MPYIANKPGTAFRTFTDKDTFTGDGSTVAFDMQFAMAEAGQNDLQVFVNDVRQIPGDDYTLGVDGTGEYKRVTFTSAPTNGHAIVILNPGTVQGEFSSVADNAVTSGKLNVDAITGQTELAEQAADGDEYLIHDTSTGTLKRIAASNVTPNETLITGKDALGTGAATNDLILIYDTSAGVLKKVTQTNLLNFPTVSSVSPTNLTSGDGTGNHTIVITGQGFTGASANLINTSGTSVSFDTVTVDSDTQITGVIAKSSLPGSGEPYDIKVTAGSGLASTLENQINIDQQPVFSTASGSVTTVSDSGRASFSAITIAAADPESGGDVTYTLESGSLPSGLSGTSTSSGYVISGTPSAVGSNTTSNFTIRAKDVNSNTSDRAFSITVLAPVVESFTSSGTFSVPSGVTAVNVLVVGGGGSGGISNYGGNGGGGAGGLIYRPGFPVTPGGTVTVTIGDGDPARSGQTNGFRGQDSVFGTLTAEGGGGGGGMGSPAQAGQPGGSGGGTGENPGTFGTGTQPTQPGDSGTYGFGNPGGDYTGGGYSAGGGGGAGAAGTTAGGPSVTGHGGIGKAYSISGTSVYYAGGGGASMNNPASAGSGDGGQGGGGWGGKQGQRDAQPGTANRGGGGGGSNAQLGTNSGGGGKGIVIVQY